MGTNNNNNKISVLGMILLMMLIIVMFGLSFYVLNLFCECISQETVESLINRYL